MVARWIVDCSAFVLHYSFETYMHNIYQAELQSNYTLEMSNESLYKRLSLEKTSTHGSEWVLRSFLSSDLVAWQ